jgi:hypothetical protein
MHLSDGQLNEYLDGALAPEMHAAAVRHLAACADCARRLAALQALFAEIESLPEVSLSRDLREAPPWSAVPVTPMVNGHATLPRWIRLTAVLEAALAVVALAFAAPILSDFITSLTPFYQMPSLAELLLGFQIQWADLVQSVPEFIPPTLPAFSLDISGMALTLTVIGAFVLWIIGNGLLLKRVTKAS